MPAFTALGRRGCESRSRRPMNQNIVPPPALEGLSAPPTLREGQQVALPRRPSCMEGRASGQGGNGSAGPEGKEGPGERWPRGSPTPWAGQAATSDGAATRLVPATMGTFFPSTHPSPSLLPLICWKYSPASTNQREKRGKGALA